MIAFNAHFDGKVIVPEHAVDLPRDRSFVVHVQTSGGADPAGENTSLHALQWLAENAVDDELPGDLSAQHDHYLYGTPKRGGLLGVDDAMSGAATRTIAAHAFERVRHDPRIEVVPHSGELNAGAIRLFTLRSDKDWSTWT
jgi:hypothetical protein